MDWSYTSLTVERIWDVMENWVMVALPMFILMGLLLDRSGVANQLMHSFARLFGNLRGGLAITVTVIGLLLAATTGIIGASVVLLALLGLPAMLEQDYDKSLAAGTVCAVGTLGILIPPSIMLVLMADRMSMSVGDLFLGAVFPGALLGGLRTLELIVQASDLAILVRQIDASHAVELRLVFGVLGGSLGTRLTETILRRRGFISGLSGVGLRHFRFLLSLL